MILHGDKTRPTVQVGFIERLGKLPRVHAGGADVARLAGFNHFMQGLQRFINGRSYNFV